MAETALALAALPGRALGRLGEPSPASSAAWAAAGAAGRRLHDAPLPPWPGGVDVDLDVIRAWWSVRSLVAARWLIEHGFDPSEPGCELSVLRSQR